MSDSIRLSLEAQGMEAFCREFAAKASGAAQVAAGMAALQALVVRNTEPDQRDGPGQRAVLEVIGRHAEAAREALWSEAARALVAALGARRVEPIAHHYGLLSREGFLFAAQRAAATMDAMQLSSAREWTAEWSRDAEVRAAAASGYPDALDFRRAGISLLEYTAVRELRDYLTEGAGVEG